MTGIGSLPHHDPHEALSFVEAHSGAIPFAPQPPPGDDLVDGIRDQLAMLRSRTGHHQAWFDTFRGAAVTGAFPRARALKVQITGPITMAHLCSRSSRPADRDPVVLATLAHEISELAVWMLRRLRPRGLPVLVVVDEPMLGAVDRVDLSCAVGFLDQIVDAVHASGGVAGLHCCTGLGPGHLASGRADLLSFDPNQGSEPSRADLEAVARRSNLVAFGLASASQTVALRSQPFASWLRYTGNPDDVATAVDLARRTIVTPTCGLGTVSPSAAEAAFRRAASVSATIAKVAHRDVPVASAKWGGSTRRRGDPGWPPGPRCGRSTGSRC